MVADILLLSANDPQAGAKPVGFLDDDPDLVGATILQLPVLGAIAQLDYFDHDAVIVGIGENDTRKRIFDYVRGRGKRIVNAVHPSAVLAPELRLGEGVVICAGVVVNTGSVIGDNVILNTGSTIDHHNDIESHSHVAPGVHLGGNVRICQGALVGIGAAVIPGRTVGADTVVGGGAIVTQDIPPGSTAVGVPARVIQPRGSEG